MLFAVGTKVKFRYTGDSGMITALLEDGMLQVRLDNDPDLEIPAFEEDLIRNADLEPVSAGAKFMTVNKDKQPEAPPRRTIKAQYHILKPRGLQLAFEPMPGRDGVVTRYKTWLINDTAHEFLIEFDLYTARADVLAVDDKLAANTALELGDLLYDHLNEQPEVDLYVRRITTAGVDEPLQKILKIKAKQFFNNFQTAPILNVQAYVYVLLESFEKPAASENPGGDLRGYTKQMTRTRKSGPSSLSTPYKPHNVEEFAQFVPEIDLHIQSLLPGYARLDKSEIVRIQLQHFQRFLEKAVRLGVPRVFVIHGVGEGKLRENIAQQLRDNPHVRKFKNEYHHKYGYGATEVFLD